MAGALAIFVSKRLQRPAAALLCLFAAQLVLSLAGRQPAPASAAAPITAAN